MNHARQVFGPPQARDEEGLRRPEGETSILLKNSSLKTTFFEGLARYTGVPESCCRPDAANRPIGLVTGKSRSPYPDRHPQLDTVVRRVHKILYPSCSSLVIKP